MSMNFLACLLVVCATTASAWTSTSHYGMGRVPAIIPRVSARCLPPALVARARPRYRQGVRMEQSMETGESSSMLLEAKRQISHLGDVENITMFVKMLKIAKEALAGALESSGGGPSGISENLIMELSLVNPLSEPARDDLMVREYVYLSSSDGEGGWERGDRIAFGCDGGGEAEAAQSDAPARRNKRGGKSRAQGGSVRFWASGGGGKRRAGAWLSSARDAIEITWEGALEGDGVNAGAQPPQADVDSMRVMYLDVDLLILESRGSPWPHVLARPDA